MTRKRTSKIWTMCANELRELVAKEKTYTAILAIFGLKNKGGNCRTLKKRLIQENIDFSHLGKSTRFIPSQFPIQDCLVENSTYSRSRLETFYSIY